MEVKLNSLEDLDLLRDLIVSSVEVVKEAITRHQDPPFTLDAIEQHPIHSREEKEVSYALKTISSATQMLRALCDPYTYINDIMYGFHDEAALLVACEADIANHLDDGPMPTSELAVLTNLNGDVLGRFLRALCNLHIFREVEPNCFANNALSVRFKSEIHRAIVGHSIGGCRRASCSVWDAMNDPEYKDSKETNKAPFNLAYDTPLDYFQYTTTVRPDMGDRTQKAMGGKGFNLDQYLSLYPWARETNAHLVDVGGATGSGTLPVLRAFPNLSLTIQDQPISKPLFEKYLAESFPDLKGRSIGFTPFDFFKEPPVRGANIYFLRHVLHDWTDEKAISILQGCASAMIRTSKLLICEHMVCPTYHTRGHTEAGGGYQQVPRPLLANWGDAPTSRIDLQVYTMLNAKCRTKMEFQSLAEQAGLELVQVWRNLCDLSIIEFQLRRE